MDAQENVLLRNVRTLMRVVIFILLLIPIFTYGQIEVIEVAPQPNVFESCCGEVIQGARWPRYNPSSWYGQPYVGGLSNSQTSNKTGEVIPNELIQKIKESFVVIQSI